MTAGIPQLRVRTEFSFKERFDCVAYGPLVRVAEVLRESGCPAAGIVDGGTWGHVRWSKAMAAAGVRPLFGTELVVPSEDGTKPSAWFLAEDTAAFYRFSTAARREGADVLSEIAGARGVLRFSGAALTDPETFDYVDLNPASPLQQRRALALSRRTGRPLVVTSDNAYPAPADLSAYMVVSGRQKVTPQHLCSEQELRAAMRGVDDETFRKAVLNTHEVVERCASALRSAPMIRFEGDLVALALAGKERRCRLGHIAAWTEEYEARMRRELAAIAEKAFESYFLVVSDIITWAKERMLVGPGRGSSAGSLVCYLIGITEVDPLVHGLLFERFIDLTRKDLPDIDIDFSDRRREMVFERLAEKYGRRNVARIGNVNTMKPRTVLDRIGRAFGIPKDDTARFVNVLIEYSSGDSRYGRSLQDTLETTYFGKQFMERYPQAAIMTRIEGHASHTGVHAAGVIVSNEPVDEYCTVGPDGVAQLDKPDAEHLNLLKIDALGLSTLGVIEDAGVVSADDLYALKMDDPKVLSVFNSGKLNGVFQFEGSAQRRVTRQIEVRSFEQVDHITALARPGPLGGGAMARYGALHAGAEAEIEPHHKFIEPMLKDTHGVVLYQEQVMRIVREIGKFSWEQTTVIRKAMSGRKGKEFFDRQGEAFVAGAAQDGISEADARAIWEEICSFGAWGMNKCAHKSTRVKLAHPNQHLGTDPTIEELYKYYVESPSAWVRQRKSMPVLLAVQDDGVARPTMAVNIIKTGAKECWRYEFTNGRVVECTPDHKFVVNNKWARIGDAKIGDELQTFMRDRSSSRPLKGRPMGIKNGRFVAERTFKKQMKLSPCQDCGAREPRMEAHHNDHAHGAVRPSDLAWLCSSCHKLRHKAFGDWGNPYDRGWGVCEPSFLLSAKSIGVHETYDIEMPAPHHNYLLANGIVTHNSHTCAYATIAYWCAWMKAYHPVEYAAAVLRHSADDEKASLRYLRELHRDGVEIVPIDPEHSDVSWVAKGGKLIGGFRNLVGFGPVKAAAAAEAARNGTMTDKMRAAVLAARNKFAELYPLNARFGDLYANPEAHGISAGWIVHQIKDLPPDRESVFIGVVNKKEMRDENETVRVAKRGGKLRTGQTLFTDLFLSDDSDEEVIARIRTKDFERFGRKAFESLKEEEDVVLVRGKRYRDSTVVFVDKLRCLTRPEVLE